MWKNEFKSRPEALLSGAVLCADALDPAWDPATQGDCAVTPVGGMEPLDKCGDSSAPYSCGEYEPPLTWPQLLARPGVTAAPCWEPANGFLPDGVTDKKLLCKHKNGLGAETTCHVDIFATGLRNAYGLTFDSAGQLWASNNGHSTDGSFPNTASSCEGFITETEAELQVSAPRFQRPSLTAAHSLTLASPSPGPPKTGLAAGARRRHARQGRRRHLRRVPQPGARGVRVLRRQRADH